MGRMTKRILLDAIRGRLGEVREALERLERMEGGGADLTATEWHLREAAGRLDGLAEVDSERGESLAA